MDKRMNNLSLNGSMSRLTKLTVCILSMAMLVLSGCATRYSVNVNAISNPSIKAPGSRYILTSARDNVDEKNLYFREFSRYFQVVLQKQGYTRVASAKEADLEIQFKFAVSDGRTGISTHSWPIYETVGGDTITITEKTTNAEGKPVTTTRTIRIPSRLERVGTSVETRSYTLYNRTAELEAHLINDDGTTGEVLWIVTLSSIGESDDLRGLMPYLAAAASGFIDKNTGRQFEVVLEPEDPLVMELKQTLK